MTLADRRQIKGHDLIEGKEWRWHQHPWKAGVRYVRLAVWDAAYGVAVGSRPAHSSPLEPHSSRPDDRNSM